MVMQSTSVRCIWLYLVSFSIWNIHKSMRFCGFVRLFRIVESHIRSIGISFLAVPFIGVRENIHSPGETRHKKACTLENRFFLVFLHSVQWFFDLVFHIIDHFTTSISPNMVNDKEVRIVSTLAFT